MTMAGRALLGATLMAALLPPSSEAQPVARTFAELRTVLKPTEYVIVVDRAARETWGKVTSVTDETLTVAPMLKTENRIETTGDRRPFPEERVAAVFRSDATGARGAGVYPVSWARVEAVPDGTELTVVLASGERRKVRAAGLTADGLRVRTASGGQEMFGRSDVLRVERHGVNDPVGNGIAIGALAGAAACWGLVAASYAGCTGSCEAPAPGPIYAIAIGMGAGVGALVGWVADRTHKGTESIFPTVVTFVTRDRKGIALSIRF
jgi:hypothetical protein